MFADRQNAVVKLVIAIFLMLCLVENNKLVWC